MDLSWEEWRRLGAKGQQHLCAELLRERERTLQRQWLHEHPGRKSAEFTRLYEAWNDSEFLAWQHEKAIDEIARVANFPGLREVYNQLFPLLN